MKKTKAGSTQCLTDYYICNHSIIEILRKKVMRKLTKLYLVLGQIGLTYCICFFLFTLRGIPFKQINQRITNGYPQFIVHYLPFVSILFTVVGFTLFFSSKKESR